MSSAVLSSTVESRASETKATTRPSVLTSTVATPADPLSCCCARWCSMSAHRVSGTCGHIAQSARTSQAITAP